MLHSVVLGVVVALLVVRRAHGDDWRVSGAWLVLVAMPVAVARDRLRPQVAEPSALNRLEAVVLCLIAANFGYLNRNRVVASSSRLYQGREWALLGDVRPHDQHHPARSPGSRAPQPGKDSTTVDLAPMTRPAPDGRCRRRSAPACSCENQVPAATSRGGLR
jgi:hypothetical protein